MMDILAAVRIIRVSFGLLLICGLFYLSIRVYLLDHLRQRLFAIRDDLFDFAADGGIAFNDPAYLELRQDLNGLIRFAHKVSALRLLCSTWATAPETFAQQQAAWEEWLRRLDYLPPLTKRKLISIRTNALQEVMLYIVRRSLALLLVYVLIKISALWLEAARSLNRRLPSFAEPLEAQARDELRAAA